MTDLVPPKAEFPALRPQRPSIAIGEPPGPVRAPENLPFFGLNALILPSPRLPTSSLPLRWPKCFGAIASPQGAFRGLEAPPEIRCLRSMPFTVKMSTYPRPAPWTTSVFKAFCRPYVTTMLPLSASMPKGVYPAGMAGSTNSVGVLKGAKVLLKTSTRALATSAASNSGPAAVLAMASPLNTAPAGVVPPAPPVGLSSTTNEGPPDQAAISPGDCVAPMESVATMNTADAPPVPPTGNPFVELYTWPVGLPPGTGTVRSRVTGPPFMPPL